MSMDIITTLFVTGIALALAGLAAWCWKVYALAGVRNDLYRCRERIHDMAIDGVLDLDEPAPRELVRVIHLVLNAIDSYSYLDIVLAQLDNGGREELHEPLFMRDPRLAPIAKDVGDAMLRGMVHSSLLLKMMCLLSVVLQFVYAPVKRFFAWDTMANLLLTHSHAAPTPTKV